MTPEDLVQARADAQADLAALEGLDPDEFRAALVAVADPLSDGIECDHKERE